MVKWLLLVLSSRKGLCILDTEGKDVRDRRRNIPDYASV